MTEPIDLDRIFGPDTSAPRWCLICNDRHAPGEHTTPLTAASITRELIEDHVAGTTWPGLPIIRNKYVPQGQMYLLADEYVVIGTLPDPTLREQLVRWWNRQVGRIRCAIARTARTTGFGRWM